MRKSLLFHVDFQYPERIKKIYSREGEETHFWPHIRAAAHQIMFSVYQEGEV